MKGVVELKRIHNKINDIDFVKWNFFGKNVSHSKKKKTKQYSFFTIIASNNFWKFIRVIRG